MKTQLLPCILLLTLLPLFISAQTNFGKFNPYDDEIVEDLQLTQEQLIQLYALDDNYGAQKTTLNDALLYHEDLKLEIQKVKASRNQGIQDILTKEQIEQYRDRLDGQLLLRKDGTQKLLFGQYLDDFQFLGLDENQAKQITKAYMDWETEPRGDRDAVMTANFKEILTKKQYKLYKKHKRNKSVASGLWNHYWIKNEERQIALNDAKVNVWKNYFVPERAVLRNNLEVFISEEDKNAIAELRLLYGELLDEQFGKPIKYKKSDNGPSKVYFKSHRAYTEYKSTALIDIPKLVERLVQSDRQTFYLAKALAVKYDELIDGIQPKIQILNQGVKERMSAYYSESDKARFYNPTFTYNKMTSTTKKIEMYRNIAFLLIGGTSNEMVNATQSHQIKAYPTPAQETQTIEFHLSKSSDVQIELLNQEGKVLKTVFQGKLEKGKHIQKVDLIEVIPQVLFYRISSTDGAKTLKTLKIQ